MESVHKALWAYSGKSLGITKHCVFNPNISIFGLSKREPSQLLEGKSAIR